MRGRGDRLAASLAERELDRILGHRPGQRRLPDRLRRHQRRLRLRRGRAPLPHRLPLHRARRGRGRGLGGRHGRGRLAGGIAERLTGRVGFEDDHMAVRTLKRLEEKLADGVELRSPPAARSRSCAGSRTRPSWRRSPPPPSSPTRSGAGALERGLAGRTEREVARAAEARMRELGAEPSFPAIVAAGPNGALPHAEPGEREIGERRAGRLRHGGEARRLLLRRHPHLRHRRARRGGARGLRDRARGPGSGARRGRRRGRGRGGRRRRPRARSPPPATASASATGSATASASRCTRRRASRRAPRTCSRPAKW